MATISIPKNYADNTTFFESDISDITNATEVFLNTTKLSSDNLVDGGVSISKFDSTIADEISITNGTNGLEIKDGGVSTAALNSLAVTTAKIADSAVTTAKILAANVTTAKIADLAVTTDKLANLTVAAADFASNSVTTAKIQNSSVVGSNLAETSNETDWVANRMVNIDLNDIGSMRIAFYNLSSTCTYGLLVAGSNLRVGLGASFDEFKINDALGTLQSSLSGVWMYLGGVQIRKPAPGLFIRVS